MIVKTYEEKMEKLTHEQIIGINIFLDIIKKAKFYDGFGAIIRVEDIENLYSELKKIQEKRFLPNK